MRAFVIFESMFGNTRMIAEAIAAGLRPAYDVSLRTACHVEAGDLFGADLIVAGGPTQAHGMSRPSTRQAALEQLAAPGVGHRLEPGATGPGLRELFADLGGLHIPAAAFDTRAAMPPVLTGRASRQIAHTLHRSGCELVLPPESFLVTRGTTLLLPGEEVRAQIWGARVAETVAARSLTDSRERAT